MAESDNILTELQDLLLYLIPQLRACLKTRFGRGDNPGGVRPSSGAAMLESGRDIMKSGASAHSGLAAPEDG